MTAFTSPQASLTHDGSTEMNFDTPLIVNSLNTYGKQLSDRYQQTDFTRAMAYAVFIYLGFLGLRVIKNLVIDCIYLRLLMRGQTDYGAKLKVEHEFSFRNFLVLFFSLAFDAN